MAGGETSATKLKLHERRSLALTLRKGGMSIRDIAAEIERRHPGTKASPATVHDDLTKTMADAAAEILAEGKQVLALELLRLDEMQLAHWLAAVGGVKTSPGSPISPSSPATRPWVARNRTEVDARSAAMIAAEPR